MKKILSALLAVCLVSATLMVPTYAAEATWERDEDIIALLSALDIMVGDDDGDFMLNSPVTRAQMAKIAVASSSYKNTVALGIQFSPFSDVRGSYWGAPYIRAAVSAGIVEGYIDGTFRPDGQVTLEEAVTMMLRVLGYTADDFGASYPYGQIGVANSLKMTEGISAVIGDPLTRREVARLVCNTLQAKSRTTNQPLIAIHDCTFIEDVTIIASSVDDSTLAENEISTTSGTYKIEETFNDNYVGCRGDMVVRDGKYCIAFSSDTDMTSAKYVVYSTLSDAILCYPEGNNTTLKQFTISSSVKCYKDSVAYSYSNLRSQMEMGDIIRIRFRDGDTIDYISYSEGNLQGPIKVTSATWYNGIDINDSTKVIRDGKQVTQESIQLNDIIYYSDALNMVMAYTQKVTGVYQDAIPSKDSPNSVVISGVTYEVEGADAFSALSSGGTINIGDTVTVLLGRDGEKIAGVVTGDSGSSQAVTGYVLASGKKNFTKGDGSTYTSYYVEVVSADGVVYTYPTAADKSSQVNTVSDITLNDGVAKVGTAKKSGLSGEVSYSAMTIGGKRVASDIRIIDIAKTAGSETPLYVKTYMQRIDGMNLTPSQVLYYNTNSSGEINELILQNVTGDAFGYGIVSGTDSMGNILIEANNITYTVSNVKNIGYGQGVKFIGKGGQPEYVSPLKAISGKATDITEGYAVIGGKTYRYGDTVAVYKATNMQYMKISVNDITTGEYSCTFYTDNTDPDTGRIRIIVAR